MPALKYPLATRSWAQDERDSIEVRFPSGKVIASFPLAFVRDGGDNTWEFVLGVVDQLVEPTPDFPGTITDGEGVIVSLENAPHAGSFVYTHLGSTVDPIPSRGPEYHSKFRRPRPGGTESTVSHSSRSTARQSKFRELVGVRDGTCLITDFYYELCTACHIVPQSRPDVYRQLLGVEEDYEPIMFDASCGLLLRDDLHKLYDRLEWSLHYKQGMFFVHFFILGHPDARKYHGIAIPPQRFRGNPAHRPNPDLTRWHYNQCAKAHIRGFSAGMALDDAGA